MVQTTMKTPYASAMPYVDKLADGLTEYDAQRLASYDLYDDLYATDPETLRKMMDLSEDDDPRFLPLAQTIVDTMSRFVGKSWRFNVLPDYGSPADQQTAQTTLEAFFRRERVQAKFDAMKPELIRRGDAIWYLRADPEKPEGTRISISTIDPRVYFPIEDPDEPDRILGAMMVEDLLNEENEVITKVQRWLKTDHPDHPSPEGEFIAYDSAIYEQGTFFEEDSKPIQITVPLDIIDGISHLPLYHIKNREQSQNPFGRSDLTGLESLCSGASQALTDQDTAIAMAGLGMFWTDSEPPTDENGEVTDWVIGPRRVVEVGVGRKFDRVAGVSNTSESTGHIRLMEDRAYGSLGISDIATGIKVDGMAGAFSGIALAIRMQPIMDAADLKDSAINAVMTQMFYDLKQWFQVYENINFGEETQIESWSSSSDRVPFDRQQAWSELMDGYNAGVFSLKYVQTQLIERFGYTFEYGDPSQTNQEVAEFRDDLEDARGEWFGRNGVTPEGANVSMDNRMSAERAAI